jgi:hypothetical protein
MTTVHCSHETISDSTWIDFVGNDSVCITILFAHGTGTKKYWIVVSLPELIPRFGRRKINTQFEKLREGRCKILEESIFILRVKLHHLTKFRILDQDHIAVRFNHMSQ